MTLYGPEIRRAALTVACIYISIGDDITMGKEVNVSGEVITGIEIEEFKNGKAETAAEVKIESERNDGIKGVLEIEMSNIDREVKLEEVFIDRKFDSGNKLVIGLTKKILGLEYDRSARERMPDSRTLIYRKLETFAYVGYETTIRYEAKPEDQDSISYKYSFGYADSLDFNISGLIMIPLNGDLSVGWSGLVQSDKINKGRQVVWASALSLLFDSEMTLAEGELIGGVDPFESEFEKTFGDSRNVLFAGGKLLGGLKLGEGLKYEPFLAYSNVRHDWEYIRYYSAEYLAGLNYHATKNLKVSANLSLVSTNSRIDYEKTNWNDSTVSFAASLYF